MESRTITIELQCKREDGCKLVDEILDLTKDESIYKDVAIIHKFPWQDIANLRLGVNLKNSIQETKHVR